MAGFLIISCRHAWRPLPGCGRQNLFVMPPTGPWLGGLVAGSEGLFGPICSATLRLYQKPEMVEDRAWFFPL